MRRKKGGRLSGYMEMEETGNPMDYMGNLADAMLVLAVGMMLALITNWNVDISQPTALQELEDAHTLSEEEMQEVEANDGLEQMGVVYQDPVTGKFFVRVQKTDDGE